MPVTNEAIHMALRVPLEHAMIQFSQAKQRFNRLIC